MNEKKTKSVADLQAQYNQIAKECSLFVADLKKMRPKIEQEIRSQMQLAESRFQEMLKEKGEIAAELREAQSLELDELDAEHEQASIEEAAKIASESGEPAPPVDVDQATPHNETTAPVEPTPVPAEHKGKLGNKRK